MPLENINPHGSYKEMNARHKAAMAMLEASHNAELMLWLQSEIKLLHSQYDHLGAAGKNFKKAFEKAACHEVIKPDLGSRAALVTHDVTRGFVNTICYGNSTLLDANPLALFGSRTHEGIHAIQFAKAAVTHATPYNHAARIALCPRDAMTLQIMKERQAFAGQLLFMDLLGRHFNGAALPTAAELQEKLLDNVHHIKPESRWETETDFLNYYRDLTLRDYEGYFPEGKASLLLKDIVFVRLELKDLAEMNEFLDFDTFGRTEAEISSSFGGLLDQEREDRLARLNRRLGIEDEGKLPLFGEALTEEGLTRADFLMRSRAWKP